MRCHPSWSACVPRAWTPHGCLPGQAPAQGLRPVLSSVRGHFVIPQDAIASVALRLVQREIGFADQIALLRRILRKSGDPETDREMTAGPLRVARNGGGLNLQAHALGYLTGPFF